MREIIASIDIGSATLKLVVAEILNERFNVLCALDEESRGVKKGVICEVQETSYAIKRLLNKAEKMLGVKVPKAIISINEDSADFKIGLGSVSITSEDKEISNADIARVLKTSRQDQVPAGNEVVDIVPISYKVDGVKMFNPLGYHGEKLEVKSVVMSVPKRDIYEIAKELEHIDVEVIDIQLPTLSTYYAHKREYTDTTAGVIIDCGAETIKIGIINKGKIINNLVIPKGGSTVDADIAFIYKLSMEDAKKVKETFALANKRNANEHLDMSMMNTLGEKVSINQKEVSEVVMSRLHELLNMAKNEINYLTKKEISYIIISGGLTEIKDFQLEIESVFGTSANLGKINIVGVRDNKYASCVGMIKYFDAKLKQRDREFSIFNQDELDILNGKENKKALSGDSILGKVFGLFNK